MKRGMIIYAVGDPPPDWQETDPGVAWDFDPKPDLVQIITRNSGHFEVHDAWFELVSKGMQLMVCKLAAFNELGHMVMTGRELRLCG